MIRAYQKTDDPQLLQLLNFNIPQYFAPSEEQDYIEYLEQHLEDYFVFEEDNQILGAGGINYLPAEGIARISWDFVHPNAHGKGIGSQLTQYRIEHIKKQLQFKEIVVRTTQLAHRFYEKQGFVLEKTAKDFWAKGFDLYQMRMSCA